VFFVNIVRFIILNKFFFSSLGNFVFEGEEVAEKKESCVQNIQELFMLLKYSGVDFGSEQAHILQKSLNELAFREGAK